MNMVTNKLLINKPINILIICLFIVFILDIITTLYIIGNGGGELNPFMVGIVEIPPLFICIKIGVGCIITAMALYAANKYKEWVWACYVLLVIPTFITLVAVFNNIFVIIINMQPLPF